MKKRGFTLAEALIALGIVAIVAMLALPMFNKTKPDPTKVAYMKTYDSIVGAVSSLITNQKLYPSQYEGVNPSLYDNFNMNAIYYDYPLLNTQAAKDVISGANLNEGNKKFCEALAFSFGASSNSCDNNEITYTDASFAPSFTTKDGTQFMVSTKIQYKPAGGPYTNALYESVVYFDVDGAKGNNCIYSATCSSPDRFKVFVLADGTVKAADPAARSYLKTKHLFNKIAMGPVGGGAVDIDSGKDAIIHPNEWCSSAEGELQGQTCSFCQEGYAIENGECILCEGTVDADGSCTLCTDMQKIWNGSVCESCPAHTKFDNGSCKSCSDFQQGWDSNSGACVSCSAQQKVWDGSKCVSCKSGEVYNDGKCIACTAPEVWRDDLGACGCPASTPYKSGNECIACDPTQKPSAVANGSYRCNSLGGWMLVCNDLYKYNMQTNTCEADCSGFGVALNGYYSAHAVECNSKVQLCDGKERPISAPVNGTGWTCISGGWEPICNSGYYSLDGYTCRSDNDDGFGIIR